MRNQKLLMHLYGRFATNARLADIVRLITKEHLWQRQRQPGRRISPASFGPMIHDSINDFRELARRYGPRTRLIDAIAANFAELEKAA